MAKQPDNEAQVDDALFWELAEPLMGAGAERSTMMGFPCLRIDGAFFASLDHRTGDLIVKLPATRVDELVGGSDAESFAPAGRVFKEWAVITDRDEPRWESLLEEARDFALSNPKPKPKAKKPPAKKTTDKSSKRSAGR